ncbi:MAG: Holliday junction branch migration protein RuvA [Clostridiales bacterium]
MIAFIRGQVFSIEEDGLTIEVHGFGLAVLAPMMMFKDPPQVGEDIFLYTHLQIREDARVLFGFPYQEQLAIFRHLLSISGIGAKTALSIVNKLSVASIVQAVGKNDLQAFCDVPGIGKKTAQRLTLELKDKLAKWTVNEEDMPMANQPLQQSAADNDLLIALGQLGFSAVESRSLSAQAREKLGDNADSSRLLREALVLASKA